MRSFDERLGQQLRALDAAVPVAALAGAYVDMDDLAVRSRRSRGPTRGLILIVAAAAALVIGATIVVGGGVARPERSEPRLEAAVAQVFASQDCLPPGQAKKEVESILGSLGYAGWTVERTKAVQDDGCVAAAVDAEREVVLLMPGIARSEGAQLDSLRAELLAGCLDKEDAMALVRSGLASIGVTDVEISTDAEFMKVVPGDPAEAARWRAHVAKGCTVLPATASWDEDGNRTIYLWSE